MKSSQVKEAVRLAYLAKKPCFIWGSPGVGKSQVVAQVASEFNAEYREVSKDQFFSLIDVRASQLDSVDVRGLPSIENRSTTWNVPDFLPKEGRGILFLDELNSASSSVQSALYQLILDRRLGDYVLPDGWLVIGAGNRETDRAIVHRMSSALANRFAPHIDFDVDTDEWIEWALGKGIAFEIIAFIRFRPDLLNAFDPQKNEKAFPTPRSWEFVNDYFKLNPSKALEYELYKGIVGEGATAEFMGFLKIYQGLQSPDVIFSNPETAKVPDLSESSVLYAICGAVVRKVDKNNFGNVVKYANRLPAEFSTLLITDCVRKNPMLEKTRTYIEWSARNSNNMI